jgi:polyisoprenoid-binding protein YceI
MTMKSLKLAAMAVAILTSFSVSAGDGSNGKAVHLKVNISKSELIWNAKKVTGEHTGTITLKEGTIILNGTKLTGGRFTADLNSITCTDLTDKTYNDKLIGHLKSDDFFSVQKHPTAQFVLTKATTKTAGVYDVTGDLTIKGITKPVTFPVTVVSTSAGTEATGKLVVDRAKYDIKYNSKSFFDVSALGDKMINDEFTINVKLIAGK